MDSDWRNWGRRAMVVGVILAAVLGTHECFAQYRVFAWDNFEGRALPDYLQMKFNASPDVVTVVDYGAPGLPAGILDGLAPKECGRYGLQMVADDALGKRFEAVVNGQMTLSREQLGERGRALYQADFYLPVEQGEGENMAVLAVAKETDARDTTSIWRNYRFGIINGTRVYYSYTDGNVKKGTPVDYKQASLASMGVTRPGWHRFQIIFEGQQNILFAIDGKPAPFSPVVEPTLTQLQAGVMMTVPEKQKRVYYADNLSIQWTPEDVPLPDSPWLSAAEAAAAAGASPSPASANPFAGGTAMPAAPGSAAVVWQPSPDKAWEEAAVQKKPVLVLFYAPRAVAYQTLEPILQSDASAQQVLGQFVPTKVEVNQLSGGTMAQRFGIFRVPTFLIMGLDGKEKGRVTFDRNSTWAAVAAELTRLRGGAQ